MKKKDRPKKKADMPEFEFKEFTPEESAIYEQAVSKFREAVGTGKTLRQAYESFPVEDKELRGLIHADFLKILIAERHFGQKQTLADIAKELDVPAKLITEVHARMLQEAGITTAAQFTQQHGDIVPKTDD
ncbi:MAG TPA: hypothetical protein VK654_08740 [Nitrospirota bacterium]|nr:hypothetical protein [Nitrospirota bacterium]